MNDLEFNLQEKSTSKIFEFFDESKKILILTTQPKKYQDKLKKNQLLIEIPEIKFDDMNYIHAYLSNKDNIDIITKKQNYDIIVLDQILEFFYDSQIFLNTISKFLSPNGMIVGCIYNFSNIINRIKFLDGTMPKNEFNSKSYLSLEDLLLSLSNSNLKITKLDRIEYEITFSNQKELKNFILPISLINSINNDPESKSFYYIFTAIPNSNLISRKSISKFSKNLVTEKLNDIFNEINLTHQHEIKYHKQTNREQYQIIKYQKLDMNLKDDNTEKIPRDPNFDKKLISQDSDDYQKHLLQQKNNYIADIIQDKDAYIADIIQDKDEYLEEIKSVVQDKDAYIADIIQDKDSYIDEIKSVVQDKDAYLEEIKSVVQDKDDYIADIIQDKDAYIADIIQDKDAYIAKIIQDKDAHIVDIKRSLPFKICKILDKLTGKTRK